MLKELLKRIPKFELPDPSKELTDYVINASNGTNPDIITHEHGMRGIFDYYGKNKEGSEQARFRIPWGQFEQIEKSYHIERKASGEFVVTLEGFFPHKK